MLILGGCKSTPPRTEVPRHDFKDKTPDATPLIDWIKLANGDTSAAIKMKAEDDKRIADLQQQHDWDQQTADMLYADKQAAIDRADAAQRAEIDRKADNAKRMFWCGIAAGMAGLAAIVLPMFGVPGIPKIGTLLMLVGGGLVVLPSLIDAAEPAVVAGSWAAVALLVGGGIIQLRSNWIDTKRGRMRAAALNPDDPVTMREATAAEIEMSPAFAKAMRAEKKRAEKAEAARLLEQKREVITP